MKSAEEHLTTLLKVFEPRFLHRPSAIESIKQIQLDAMKEGMRRAAEIVLVSHNKSETLIRQDILTAVEQLTEKDL
jgi:hypothetical protein